jgi:hypothetical protein
LLLAFPLFPIPFIVSHFCSPQNFRVFQNTVLGTMRNEVTGGWRKLHNEEFHNLYFSPSIMRMIKLRRRRWPGHVALLEGNVVRTGTWREIQKERTH